MSIICALRDAKDGSIWIGSDYLLSYGSLCFKGREPKWVVAGRWAIGHAGQMRAGNLLEQHWKAVVTKHQDIHSISAALRQLLVDDGYKVKEEEFQRFGQDMVVTDSEHIWSVSSDFAYAEYPDDQLYAEGSGWHLALGAAHALQGLRNSPPTKEIVKAAIEAANAYDSGCGQGVWVKQMKTPAAKATKAAKAAPKKTPAKHTLTKRKKTS